MIARIVLLSIAFFVIPFLIGMLFNKIATERTQDIVLNYVNGFVLCLGLLQVLVLPCIMLDISLTALTFVYVGILIGVSIVSVVKNRNDFPEVKAQMIETIKKLPWYMIFVIAFMAFQCYMYIAYSHTDYDDSFYVASAVAAVDTDTVFQIDPYTGDRFVTYPMRYVLSPFSIFTAILSKVFGVHATILSHTVLPPLYLSLTYGVYWLLGDKFFKGKKEQNAKFLFFAMLISTLLSTTKYTQGSFMLLRIWQGKAFLASFLIPYVFYLEYKLLLNDWKKKEWTLVLFAMLASCLVSSMGIILGAIMVGIMGILYALVNKNPKKLLAPMLCCVPNIILAVFYLFA